MIITKDSQKYYKIQNVHLMQPFLITVATSSDMWLFLSSNGALTAGRENAGKALFPYETDDRVHLATSTGPKTIIKVNDDKVWQPFNIGFERPYKIERNLSKRTTGDALLFEEINFDLGLKFSYLWETSETYGVVRTSYIENLNESPLEIQLLDGVENVMPYGIPNDLAAGTSCLTDAYKVVEKEGRMAIYSLTSMIGDTPEPVEVLHANVVWQIDEAPNLLSSKQVAKFARGEEVEFEKKSVGQKGAFFIHKSFTLEKQQKENWLIILDAGLSQGEIVALSSKVNGTDSAELRKMVVDDVRATTTNLVRNVGASDGLQKTADELSNTRHFMNSLFNNMRGGVFLDGYDINPNLFIDFVQKRNRQVIVENREFFDGLQELKNINELHQKARTTKNPDLIRLSLEFLPLTFSRRHGDPSRPWNHFNIKVKDEKGNPVYAYEGNWRDIFQNWEAMSRSFPAYIIPMIVKFLNASTVDGFNPYRITHEGVDWELPIPGHHSGGFGYWGDHQIVYLTKLLEWANSYYPEGLNDLFTAEIFSYSNIPYELKSWETLKIDAKNTLSFNQEKHESIQKLVSTYGSDGRLVLKGSKVHHVNFVEKIIVPILSKLSNLVPEGGIWMNTQRPEWNDANNAIVGNGLSMVTVYQLYRHLKLLIDLFKNLKDEKINISIEVVVWLKQLVETFDRHDELTALEFLDEVGEAFSRYRLDIYSNSFSGEEEIEGIYITSFFESALGVLGKTIEANKREDGMYHAYNILHLSEESLQIEHMFLMLEGQSAVLASTKLKSSEALTLIQAMEASDLMNPLLNQFFLYPKKELKTFLNRNIIASDKVAKSQLIQQLLNQNHDGFIVKDAKGNIRFHESVRQSSDVRNWLSKLNASAFESQIIEDIYEEVFEHKKFTGRSGIMYKYEGIGCIFWHQNSKCLLAIQEKSLNAKDVRTSKALKEAYYRLRNGFGIGHTAQTWGAFPLEPYSHTPYDQPASQPGLTGQAKEDVMIRSNELGIEVENGILNFNPQLLRKEEIIERMDVFRYVNAQGEIKKIKLPMNSLAFTVCRVPVIYSFGEKRGLQIMGKEEKILLESKETTLTKEWSRRIFDEDNSIEKIAISFLLADLMS